LSPRPLPLATKELNFSSDQRAFPRPFMPESLPPPLPHVLPPPGDRWFLFQQTTPLLSPHRVQDFSFCIHNEVMGLCFPIPSHTLFLAFSSRQSSFTFSSFFGSGVFRKQGSRRNFCRGALSPPLFFHSPLILSPKSPKAHWSYHQILSRQAKSSHVQRPLVFGNYTSSLFFCSPPFFCCRPSPNHCPASFSTVFS